MPRQELDLLQFAAGKISSKVVSKPWQDFPAINRQLKSVGLTELLLEAALPATSQANGNNE